MGSFEKLVVLTVFFLSAVVLAVSLTTHGEGDSGRAEAVTAALPGSERAGRVDRALAEGAAVPEQASGRPARAADPAPSVQAPQAGPSQAGPVSGPSPSPTSAPARSQEAPAPRNLPTLASTLQGSPSQGGAAPAPGPAAAGQGSEPAGALLRHRRGLEPSPVDGVWLYTWQSSDSWTSVATHFYGSGAHAESLRVANDDASPAAGRRIFVPENPGAAGAGSPAARPRDDRAALREAPAVQRPAPASGTPAGNTARTEASGSDGSGGATFLEHRVEAGETLSSISERYYGTPARWRRIYDANRDRMASPDVVRQGQVLRIP